MELTLDEALQKGIEAHKAGQVQDAERLYTAVLKAQPKHPVANHNTGVLAVGMGKIQEALPFFKTALESNPSAAQFWLSYVGALIKLDKWADAKAALKEAKDKGANGEAFDQLEQKLGEQGLSTKSTNKMGPEESSLFNPNILSTIRLDKALRRAKQKFKEGQFVEAKSIYEDILEKFPKNKRALLALDALTGGAIVAPQDPPSGQLQPILNLFTQGQLQQALLHATEMLGIFPTSVALYNIAGASNAGLMKFDAALENYKQVLRIIPNYAEAYCNMGITLNNQGNLEAAIDSYKQAVKIKPDYVTAFYNMGNTQKANCDLTAALKSYKQTVKIDPNYADAYCNMGIVLDSQGDLEGAIHSYKQALKIKTDYAQVFYNMGNTQRSKRDLTAALYSYKQAIKIKPDYARAYNNMGITLADTGDLNAALDSYKQALKFKPDYANAFYNMGICQKDKGDLESSISSLNMALKIKPDYDEVWNSLIFSLQAMKLQIPDVQKLLSTLDLKVNSKYVQIAKSVLSFSLHMGGENAERSLNEVCTILSSTKNAVIKNPEVPSNELLQKDTGVDKVVALVHFGRSGTGLLHSLIDSHPEVSTMPSIYFSEFFNDSTWEKIVAGGWSQMADRFIETYDVLFDASVQKSIETKSKKFIDYLGKKEGMANLGDQRGEVLCLDKALFRRELNSRMSVYNDLDTFTFFQLAHFAYDMVLNHHTHKHLIFYHIHNPDTHTQLNFVHAVPNANWIMMVREPLQACESWIKDRFHKNEYAPISVAIVTMLLELDNVIYKKQNAIGVRLEDLKESPRKTIPALCDWMGIKETESLYEMTAQGKKWWGDPASPDYAKDGMEPFGKTSIRRKLGSVFPENDQFILRTLFYPFSVQFGYVEKNSKQFKADLKAIRPMLDDMFGFEKTLTKRTKSDPEQFMKSGSYLYLRSVLIERWNVLNKFDTYPNMIKPLNIN